MSSSSKAVLPKHVAIILDGNGRWAKQRGLPRNFGHKKGAENVKEIVRAASDAGVKILTLYAFSTENWKRSAAEVRILMELFGIYLESYTEELRAQQVRVHIIGERGDLAAGLQAKAERLEAATAMNTGMVLNIAINYGGRTELLRAMAAYAATLPQPAEPSAWTEEGLAEHLYPGAQDDVDLLIRTGGDFRISNFLLWQISYAELYFTPTLWPDFTATELRNALQNFGRRERRFGGVNEGE